MRYLRALKFVLFINLNAFVLLSAPVFAQTVYSRSTDLPALRISLAELQAVLNKASSLIKSANGSAPVIREAVKLGRGDTTIELSGSRIDPTSVRLPAIMDTFEFAFATQNAEAVSRLYLSFEDYRRTLRVEGQSPDQVDALFVTLRDMIISMSAPIGGTGARTFAFMVVVFGIVVLVFSAIAWLQTRKTFPWMPALVGLLAISFLYFVPLTEVLAGFLVFVVNPTFLVRYGPEISFLSLLLGAVGIVLPFFLRNTTKKDSAAKASKEEVVS